MGEMRMALSAGVEGRLPSLAFVETEPRVSSNVLHYCLFILCGEEEEHMCAMAQVWRSEKNFLELEELFFCLHMGPGNPIQVVNLSGKHLYPPCHVACPLIRLLFYAVSMCSPDWTPPAALLPQPLQ